MTQSLSTASLRSLLALSEKRDALLAEIKDLDFSIIATFGGSSAPAKAPALKAEIISAVKASGPGKRGKKRGAVKEVILAALKEAGESGVAVRHLAARHGLKPASVHVWFGTTGKKSGLIEALGKGVYRLKQSLGALTSSSELQAPKPEVTAEAPVKPAKKAGRKPGRPASPKTAAKPAASVKVAAAKKPAAKKAGRKAKK